MCDRAKGDAQAIAAIKAQLEAHERRLRAVEKFAGKSVDVPRKLPKSPRHG